MFYRCRPFPINYKLCDLLLEYWLKAIHLHHCLSIWPDLHQTESRRALFWGGEIDFWEGSIWNWRFLQIPKQPEMFLQLFLDLTPDPSSRSDSASQLSIFPTVTFPTCLPITSTLSQHLPKLALAKLQEYWNHLEEASHCNNCFFHCRRPRIHLDHLISADLSEDFVKEHHFSCTPFHPVWSDRRRQVMD